MSVPSWLNKETYGKMYSKWGLTESWFIHKDGTRYENVNHACWAGLERNIYGIGSVAFAFTIRDYFPNRETDDCIFLHMVDEARQIGFEFEYEKRGTDVAFQSWEVTVDTTITSGVEIYLLAGFLRNIYENPSNVYCYFKLREKYPDVDLFTLQILSHYLSFDNIHPRLGHTWICSHLTYLHDDYLGKDYLEDLRKITKPYNVDNTYTHPTVKSEYPVSTSLLGEKGAVPYDGRPSKPRKNPLLFSEEAFQSFFSKEKYEEFLSNPDNLYIRGW